MRPGGHSEAAEMYLKSLAVLGGADHPVAASLLAARLAVSAVAANEMLRRLIREGLVRHEPYRGYGLTDLGRDAAWDVIRRERLWECFLVEHLAIDPAAAVAAACLLEHATTPDVIDALDAFLGRPATCPQGQPIPRTAADRVQFDGGTLADAEAGTTLRLVAFDEDDAEILAYLRRGGLAIGETVVVVEVAPRRSATTVSHRDQTLVLGRDLASAVQVAVVHGTDAGRAEKDAALEAATR